MATLAGRKNHSVLLVWRVMLFGAEDHIAL
jgi:hypothetical protein